MVMFIIWVMTIILAMSVLGGIVHLNKVGFNWKDFIGLVVIMIIFVVFGTIALTGQFVA
jgi:hypothetical protein